jgi:hypothetical protein
VSIISGQEIVLAVRFTLPPGQSPERAAQMLSQGGVNLPLSLCSLVRRIDVAVVDVGQPFLAPPVEEAGANLKLQ